MAKVQSEMHRLMMLSAVAQHQRSSGQSGCNDANTPQSLEERYAFFRVQVVS